MNAGKRSFYKNLALSTIEATPVLDEFRGLLFNEQIEQFQRLDQELRQLTRQEIYCKLSANVPNFTKEASKNSEIGILLTMPVTCPLSSAGMERKYRAIQTAPFVPVRQN